MRLFLELLSMVLNTEVLYIEFQNEHASSLDQI